MTQQTQFPYSVFEKTYGYVEGMSKTVTFVVGS